MQPEDKLDRDVTAIGAFADRTFLKIEIVAYAVLGLLLAVTAILGIGGIVVSLLRAVRDYGDDDAVVIAIDRLLFVLMVVEILHTVRVSFRVGTLVCEPFLIVGLIASIRRVLVITLESSQASKPGAWTPDVAAQFNGTMLELGVLGGLILVMVMSIYVLRRGRIT